MMRTKDEAEHHKNSTNDRFFCPAQSTWEGVFNAGSHAVSHDASVV